MALETQVAVEWIGLLVAAWLGNVDAAGHASVGSWLPDVTFRPRERSVSNWRSEAATHIDSPGGMAINILLGRDPPQVTRCVRLNNYWCIKRAGWAGEIAADPEGHVAFASAAEGADVAALLLRRYYLDYGRHSALAIVSHWAPASCGALASATLPGPGSRRARAASPRPSPADHLAVHGLGHTLRARFLASRGRRMTGGIAARPRRSVIPDRLIAAVTPAPSIAVGLGEKPLDLGMRSFPLASLSVLDPPLAAAPGPASARRWASATMPCASDSVRIANYAAKAAAGVARSATDDLHLFDANGTPAPNLARVMHNMSAVEIGPLGASRALIAAAVDHATTLVTRQASAAPSRSGKAPVADR